MNEKIVDILRISDEPDKLYAAQYIENLKTSQEILRSNYLLIAGAGAKESDSPEHIAEIIRNTRLERDQLKARVAKLEVEGKQVCESTIFEQDYQTSSGDWESAYRCRTGCGVQQKISSDTCHDCGKRIKYVEVE